MEMTQGLIEFNWSSLMILCNVFILYLILRKFFWEKIKKFMDDRAAAVQDAIDAAEAQNKRADEKMANYSKRIANVEEEGREIIKASLRLRSSLKKRASRRATLSQRPKGPSSRKRLRPWRRCERRSLPLPCLQLSR